MDAFLDAPCGMGLWVAGLAGLLLLALAAGALARLVASLQGPSRSPVVCPPGTPLAVLNRLYAHGELSTRDYEEQRRLLGA